MEKYTWECFQQSSFFKFDKVDWINWINKKKYIIVRVDRRNPRPGPGLELNLTMAN